MFSEASSIQEVYAYPFEQNGEAKKALSSSVLRGRKRQLQLQSESNDKNSLYMKLKIIKHVGTFIQNLKSSITLRKPYLRPQEISFLQNQTKGSEPEQLLSHHHPVVIFSQILLLVFLGINVWKNTYEMVLGPLFEVNFIEMSTFIVYVINLALFLNTELKTQKYEILANRSQILAYYIDHKIGYQIAAASILLIQFFDADAYFYELFIVIRILSLVMILQMEEIYSRLQNATGMSPEGQFAILMGKLLFKICIFLHFVSLFLNFVRNVQMHYGVTTTWIEKGKIQYSSSFQLYVVGWYWGSTILSTVGFGDITPANNFQRGVVSFIQVACALIFGFFVNYIGSLIKVRAQTSELFEKEIRNLNSYLGQLTIPNQLKSDVRSHFVNKRQFQKIYNPSDEQNVMQSITTHLKNDILLANNLHVLQETSIINIFSIETIRKVAIIIKKIVYMPQQLVYSRQSKDIKLWIVDKGVVEDRWNSENSKAEKAVSIYNRSRHQNIVGWINFVTDRMYRITAKAKTFSIMYELSKKDFLKVIKQNKRDFHKMMEFKQTMIEKKMQFQNKCVSCGRFTHNAIVCPRIHFKPRPITLIIDKQKMQSDCNKGQLRNKKFERQNARFQWKANQKTIPRSVQQAIAISSEMINESIQVKQCEIRKIMHRHKERDNNRCSVQGRVVSQKNSRFSLHQALNCEKLRKTMFSRGSIPAIDQKSTKNLTTEKQLIQQAEEQNLQYDLVFFNEQKDYFPASSIEAVVKKIALNKCQQIKRKYSAYRPVQKAMLHESYQKA